MTLLSVIDTETTGLEESDQIVELAIVMLSGNEKRKRLPKWLEMERWSSLVRPTCPVSPGARATHHISDGMLAESWTMAEMMEQRGLPELGHLPERHAAVAEPESDIVVVGHNVEFDVRMLAQSGFALDTSIPRICTYKCAQHLVPESPSHSNQVLRYFLELDVPQLETLPPHRALPDALVTAALLLHLLTLRNVMQLVELTSTPVLLRKVTFGQHRGRAWEEMDSGFLRWVLGRDFGDDVKHTARHWLEQRGK